MNAWEICDSTQRTLESGARPFRKCTVEMSDRTGGIGGFVNETLCVFFYLHSYTQFIKIAVCIVTANRVILGTRYEE